jgi:hypothetical protein
MRIVQRQQLVAPSASLAGIAIAMPKLPQHPGELEAKPIVRSLLQLTSRRPSGAKEMLWT